MDIKNSDFETVKSIMYRDYRIDIVKDIDPYNPKELEDIYIFDGVLDKELLEKEYQDYLNKNVFGYIILDKFDNLVDDLWGFFGEYSTLDIEDKAKERVDTFLYRENN